MQIYFCFTLLLFVGVNADRLRAYNNPLNNKAVDVFFLVDETNLRMNLLQLGQLKIALNSMVTDLQPVGSSPYFGVFFYGATSIVHPVVPFPTTLATVVKTNLDMKQYAPAQSNPSTFSLALASVNTLCQLNCRPNTPRVIVVITPNPDPLGESQIRQLERDLSVTVIVVGIGSLAHTATLNNLASYPNQIYAVPFVNFAELVTSALYVSSLISDVPRSLAVGISLLVSTATTGVYNTIQLNTYGYISTNDTVVTYTTNCVSCAIYASLSEPNPSSVNALQSTNRQVFSASGYTHYVYYFRIPINANRFYLSFVSTGMPSVTGIFNIFNMPPMMSFPAKAGVIPDVDVEESIG